MATSARNVFSGKITSVIEGPIHAEVELVTTGGDKVVAVVTEGSVKSLGLAVGTEAKAFVKAPWVMLLKGEEGVRFSARNHLAGKVSAIKSGAVNSDVTVTLPGGTDVQAVITNEAVSELALVVGDAVSVLFKASHVILGVPA